MLKRHWNDVGVIIKIFIIKTLLIIQTLSGAE